jgi:hypothetical protein
MLKNAVSWGIIVFCIFLVGCSSTHGSASSSDPLLPTHKEDRVSEAPPDGVAVRLNDGEFNNRDAEFLLTLSNSTPYLITLFTSTTEHCYSDTFWFLANTETGWKPIPPVPSFKCFPSLRTDLYIQIRNGLEKEFNLGFLFGSRGLFDREPAFYQMKVRYLSQTEELLFLYADNFQIGSSAQFFEPSIRVQLESNGSDFSLVNNWDQTIWLSPLCTSVSLISGWMDEEVSNLQQLTDEGSWSLVEAETDPCPEMTELIEVKSGETYLLDTAKWIQDANLLLQPGIYRWDIVYYLNRTTRGVEDGRHAFTDTFVVDH